MLLQTRALSLQLITRKSFFTRVTSQKKILRIRKSAKDLPQTAHFLPAYQYLSLQDLAMGLLSIAI